MKYYKINKDCKITTIQYYSWDGEDWKFLNAEGNQVNDCEGTDVKETVELGSESKLINTILIYI